MAPNHYQQEWALLLPRRRYTTHHMHQAANRKRRAVLKKTPAEKAQLQVRCNARKVAYRSALEKARRVVMEHAKQLCGEFGHHNTDYYYKEIMQLARKTKTKRAKVNMWNAFTRLQAQALNEGKYAYCTMTLILTSMAKATTPRTPR